MMRLAQRSGAANNCQLCIKRARKNTSFVTKSFFCELFICTLFYRFLLFLKLFLGMGLLWVFEIFAGISSVDWWVEKLPKPRKIYVKNILWFRHLTNILNMLQGLYIFLIFVCKRNVFEAISKMRKGSQTLTGLNLLRSKNKGPSATIMTRMSKLTSSFHRSSGPNTDPNVI